MTNAPFNPINLQINSPRSDANTSEPCEPLPSVFDPILQGHEHALWQLIRKLGEEEFIMMPCHGVATIDWPKGGRTND